MTIFSGSGAADARVIPSEDKQPVITAAGRRRAKRFLRGTRPPSGPHAPFMPSTVPSFLLSHPAATRGTWPTRGHSEEEDEEDEEDQRERARGRRTPRDPAAAWLRETISKPLATGQRGWAFQGIGISCGTNPVTSPSLVPAGRCGAKQSSLCALKAARGTEHARLPASHRRPLTTLRV